MQRTVRPGVVAFEEKHLIAILLHLASNGPSRKVDLYKAVSSNPRMPDKIDTLEAMGLVVQDFDAVTRSTLVYLTPGGDKIASMFIAADRCLRCMESARVY